MYVLYIYTIYVHIYVYIYISIYLLCIYIIAYTAPDIEDKDILIKHILPFPAFVGAAGKKRVKQIYACVEQVDSVTP